MPGFWSSLCLAGLACIQQAFTSPVPVEERSLSKRSTIAGPKVSGANFPDPAIIHTDKWHCFATRTIGSSIHVQVATSGNYQSWRLAYNSDGSQYDALPNLPDWVAQPASNVWAPDVQKLDDGTFILYYSASTKQDASKHCVGAATASTARGPYTPVGSEPLFCPLSEGGAIDAAGYNDNGQRYVVYKVDGNSLGHGGSCGNTVAPIIPTPIKIQPVAADGHTFTGPETTILDHEGTSDDGVVEAPVVVKKDGTYFLLFSPGCFTTGNYRVAYATAPSITGPYTRNPKPLVKTGDNGLTAPGGADVSKDLKFLVFHANSGAGRSLYTGIITVSGTTLSI